MSGRDFFTLQRRIFAPDSWLWDLPSDQTKVAITLIGMANWKEGKKFYGGQMVKVSRGQVMTSLEKIAEKSRVSIRTVRTTLKNLETAEFLTNESTNKFRIITILNYDKEQSPSSMDRQADGQASDRLPTSKRQATDKQATGRATTIEPVNQGTRETKEPGKQHTLPGLAAAGVPAPAKPARWKPTDSQLEAVYRSYPKRTEKAKGLAKLKNYIWTEDEFEQLVECVEAMAHDWRGADTTYCPGFMPFVNGKRWMDDERPKPRANSTSGTGHYNHTGAEVYAGGDVEI